MPVLSLNANDLGDLIGIPPADWEARCYEIACLLVDKKLIEGTAVYGHYRGPITEDTRWDRCRSVGFARHGWIVTGNGRIVDPLRWSFEGKEPYVYETTEDDEDYDEGGNVLREMFCKPCPSSHQEPTEPVELLFSEPQTEDFVCTLLGFAEYRAPTGAQVFWMANLPLTMLGAFAADLYSAIAAADRGALIPIDNRRKVQREVRTGS